MEAPNQVMANQTDSSLPPHDIAGLNRLYSDAESCDADVFSEMRSNVLLIAGEHYTRKQSAFFKRIRDNRQLNDQQKLRLTKNHVQKITKTYVNNILSMSPGVGFMPKHEAEVQDQKAAELHESVWQDALDKYNLRDLMDDWADDFVGIGEVITKIFYDESGGDLLGHSHLVDENGQPQFDETGQAVPDESQPVYSGEFIFETIHGFNLLRAVEAKDMRKSPFLINRKMVEVETLKAKFPEFATKINADADKTMVVFDATSGGYRKNRSEVMLREFYFRPCAQYPKGYYFFAVAELILVQGELPGGIFPIVTQAFDKIQTTPRGRSPVKIMRPYQAEINRASSKIAEHQITLGDDKLLIQNGTKVSAGTALPGVRAINYTGMQPGILQGRDGSQYLAYMQSQIAEMYQVLNVAEDSAEQGGQLDPYALLFKSATQKKKFQRYVKRFEKFLMEVAKTYIKLAKLYMNENTFVLAVGRTERVNISEFKNQNDTCYEVKVIPQADDIETKMGKQLTLNHILQYVGGQLDKESIGKIMREMPYGNSEEAFSDFTLDYDLATNDILALDRGEMPALNQYDNHTYLIKKLTARSRAPDFKFLDPQIQGNYAQSIQMHEQAEVQRQQQIQAAQAGFIPTGGYMVVCDLYVQNDPKDPQSTKRVRLPFQALNWLIEKLQTQGQSLQELENMNQGAVAEMANMFTQRAQSMGGGAHGSAPSPAQGPQGPGGANGMAPFSPNLRTG